MWTTQEIQGQEQPCECHTIEIDTGIGMFRVGIETIDNLWPPKGI